MKFQPKSCHNSSQEKKVNEEDGEEYLAASDSDDEQHERPHAPMREDRLKQVMYIKNILFILHF